MAIFKFLLQPKNELEKGGRSALPPQAGDRNQQRMMMVMMPAMMLVMFYNFPSALSLYWTLSQVLSIVQMYLIRRQAKPALQAK